MEYTPVDLWTGRRRWLSLCSISFANQRDRLAFPFCHGVGSWSEPSHGWATTVASLGTTRSIPPRRARLVIPPLRMVRHDARDQCPTRWSSRSSAHPGRASSTSTAGSCAHGSPRARSGSRCSTRRPATARRHCSRGGSTRTRGGRSRGSRSTRATRTRSASGPTSTRRCAARRRVRSSARRETSHA